MFFSKKIKNRFYGNKSRSSLRHIVFDYIIYEAVMEKAEAINHEKLLLNYVHTVVLLLTKSLLRT
ncbi:MAG: hypothetical protein ACI8RD_006013 [Bacillariaceae sp.]|jgi:hypothetical protein